MKLGMIHNCPTAESLQYVKGLGLSFVEMCNNNNDETIQFSRDFAKTRALIEDAGLEIGSIGRWNIALNIGGKINEPEYEVIQQNLDDAIACGCPTFVCGCNYDPGISLYRNYSTAIEVFGRFLDRAKGTGTKVAVYNCDWNNFVHSPEQWEVILGELPELYIKYDASHAYNRGEDYLAQLSDYGERVAHVHIKGTTHAGKRTVDDPPAGMDDINWRSLFAILYSRRYDGDLSIEPHSAVWHGELGAAGVEFTRKFIKEFMMK
jgi:sugar phosphate isomerase/epimerase